MNTKWYAGIFLLFFYGSVVGSGQNNQLAFYAGPGTVTVGKNPVFQSGQLMYPSSTHQSFYPKGNRLGLRPGLMVPANRVVPNQKIGVDKYELSLPQVHEVKAADTKKLLPLKNLSPVQRHQLDLDVKKILSEQSNDELLVDQQDDFSDFFQSDDRSTHPDLSSVEDFLYPLRKLVSSPVETLGRNPNLAVDKKDGAQPAADEKVEDIFLEVDESSLNFIGPRQFIGPLPEHQGPPLSFKAQATQAFNRMAESLSAGARSARQGVGAAGTRMQRGVNNVQPAVHEFLENIGFTELEPAKQKLIIGVLVTLVGLAVAGAASPSDFVNALSDILRIVARP